MSKKSKRNKMPGLRLKGEYWHIERRCKYAENGWLRESTGETSRTQAEKYLVQRLADIEKQAQRRIDATYTFEEAGLRYLEDIAHKSSASSSAIHLDQLFPFIGELTLELIHDDTLKSFIKNELERGIAPKTINNAIGVISAVLNRAARVWRDEDGRPWLRQAPAKLSRLSLKGQQAKPYPLSWAEQDKLFSILSPHIASAALFAVNTGCREQEVCQLRWQWEVPVAELGVSVFVLPEDFTKTGTGRIVVLNSIARKVIDEQRGKHPEFVFTFRKRPFKKMRNNAWRRAWEVAGLPTRHGILKGVHNLRHTAGRRLRAAAVPLETRKVILGHANGDITTHYSAAELGEILNAAERIVDRKISQTPTLSLVRKTGCKSEHVGKVSEHKKRASGY